MAKSNSLFDPQGTFGNVTYVNSKTYGKHVRAPRGTHKPVTINDAFKQSGKELVNANLTAKMIKDALDPYRVGLRDGTLWQRLVALFKSQIKNQPSPDLSGLEEFELHKTHRLYRHLNASVLYRYTKHDNAMQVTLRYRAHPEFKGHKRLDSYCLKLIALFPVMALKTATTIAINLPVVRLTDPLQEIETTLYPPAVFDEALFCLRIDGCTDGQPSGNPRTKGMGVIKAVAHEGNDLRQARPASE